MNDQQHQPRDEDGVVTPTDTDTQPEGPSTVPPADTVPADADPQGDADDLRDVTPADGDTQDA